MICKFYCLFSPLFCLYANLCAQSDTTHFKKYEQEILGTGISFCMMPIKGGAFVMGSNADDKNAKADEKPAKKIIVSDFWIGANEVTYDEYDAFFKDEVYSRNQPEPDAITRPSPPYIDLTLGMGKEGGFPANSMSQYGALMYCSWLYDKTGVFYRLPTEAEWEYACRAGTPTKYFFGNDTTGLSNYAWYESNSGDKYHKTGMKKSNPWGLYDILGNVAEWTLDQYDESYFSNEELAQKDPLVLPTSRHPRTLRGGSYQDKATDLRSASRLRSNTDWNRRDPQIPRSRWWNADAPFIGFRIVRPAVEPSKEDVKKFFERYLDNY
jgi:formylglycine-generating enzyme required for sulfatase activity